MPLLLSRSLSGNAAIADPSAVTVVRVASGDGGPTGEFLTNSLRIRHVGNAK